MPDYQLKLYRGRYYADWLERGQTRRNALRTADRAEAERRLIDFARSMAVPAGAAVGEIVEAYLKEKEGRIVDVRRLQDAWRRAKPTFGNIRPDQVTRDLCRAYTAERRGHGVSDATIIKELNVVRQGLNYGKVPGAVFEAPSAPQPRDRHLTKEERHRKPVARPVQPLDQFHIALQMVRRALDRGEDKYLGLGVLLFGRHACSRRPDQI